MDIILPFMLDNGFSRGAYINADQTLADILAGRNYPLPVANALADAIILTFALCGNIKYAGVFLLNVKGNGPVSGLVVSTTNDFQARAYAVFDEEKVQALGENPTNQELFGDGTLLFSVAQPGQEPYQGIIKLTKESLLETILDYFCQSEQIKTDIVFRKEGLKRRCLVLQQMPLKGSVDLEEAAALWETQTVLMNSVQNSELFDDKLTPNDILYRLFHANEVRVFESKAPIFSCPCHRSTMQKFLQKLSPEEREDLYQDGKITTECQYCGNQFTFTKEDF